MCWANQGSEEKIRVAKEQFYQHLGEEYLDFHARESKKSLQSGAVSILPRPLQFPLAQWNNAALLAYSNYFADYSQFEQLLAKCSGDLRRFIQWIAHEHETKRGRFDSAPEEYLAALIREQNCPSNL